VAEEVQYDADVKIHVEGFKADVASRYGGNLPFIIWKEGAEHYWGPSLYLKGKAAKAAKAKNNQQIKMEI
jgi:hypothetical protein